MLACRASLQDLPVSGVFYGNDPNGMVQALVALWHLKAERTPAGKVVLER